MPRIVTTMSMRCASSFGVSHLAGSAVAVELGPVYVGRLASGLAVTTLGGRFLGVVDGVGDVKRAGNARRRARPARAVDSSGFVVASLVPVELRFGVQIVYRSGDSDAVTTGPGWAGVEVGLPGWSRFAVTAAEVLVRRRKGARRLVVRTLEALVRTDGPGFLVLCRTLWCGESTGRCGCSTLSAEVAAGGPCRLLVTFDAVRGFRPRIWVTLRLQVAPAGSSGCW